MVNVCEYPPKKDLKGKTYGFSCRAIEIIGWSPAIFGDHHWHHPFGSLSHGSSRTQKFFSAWVMDDHEIYDDYHHPYPSPEWSPKCPNFIWNMIPGWNNLKHYHPYYPIIIHIPNISLLSPYVCPTVHKNLGSGSVLTMRPWRWPRRIRRCQLGPGAPGGKWWKAGDQKGWGALEVSKAQNSHNYNYQ